MTLSQRSGITSYLEGDAADSDGRQGPKQLGASEGDDEGGSSSSDDDERRDPLETWMIMVGSSRGSAGLSRAARQAAGYAAHGEVLSVSVRLTGCVLQLTRSTLLSSGSQLGSCESSPLPNTCWCNVILCLRCTFLPVVCPHTPHATR